jgi:hypothetical protein
MLLIGLMLVLIVGSYLLCSALVVFSENIIRPRSESGEQELARAPE